MMSLFTTPYGSALALGFALIFIVILFVGPAIGGLFSQAPWLGVILVVCAIGGFVVWGINSELFSNIRGNVQPAPPPPPPRYHPMTIEPARPIATPTPTPMPTPFPTGMPPAQSMEYGGQDRGYVAPSSPSPPMPQPGSVYVPEPGSPTLYWHWARGGKTGFYAYYPPGPGEPTYHVAIPPPTIEYYTFEGGKARAVPKMREYDTACKTMTVACR